MASNILPWLTGSSAKYEPLPRFSHIEGNVSSKVIVQGGRTKEKNRQHLSSVVEIFDPYSESWEQRQVKGDAPSCETYLAASASLHDDLFSFGGYDGRQRFNTVHKLDSKTWCWTQLSPQNADGAPMPKCNCGMVALRNLLVVIGGYGIPRGPTSFIKNTRVSDGSGWTNEFHIYNLSQGVWSCPATTGETPPPCAAFTFTAVDDKRAVMFGGNNGEQGKMNDVYLFDIPTMNWSKLKSEGGPLPKERSAHAACCLNYGQQFPQLLVTGGMSREGRPLADMWILDIEKAIWRKEENVAVKARCWHSLTAFSLGPGRTDVIEFGGTPDQFLGSHKKQPKKADTALLQLRLSETSKWELLSIVNNTQCGSQQRMMEKFRYTAESWQQLTGESEMTRMERLHLERDRDRAREEKRVMEEERDRERERVRELEEERDRERERARELEGERDREREFEEERDKERMRARELEGERDREWKKVKVLEEEKEMEKERVRELEGERDRERERVKVLEEEKEMEKERVRELEEEKDREKERVKVLEEEIEKIRERVRVLEGEKDREKVRAMKLEEDRVRLKGLEVVRERWVRELERRREKELQQCQARASQLQQRLVEFERRDREKLAVQEQAIAAEQRGPSWEVKEDELEETEETLGIGGWAVVKVAKLKVAAKCLHSQLIYDYHRRLFRREMDVAATVSHPNLLRFLGARLEGGMAILTEFMPTSLRALVNRRPRQLLSLEHILSIAIDVARALNYLHNMSPDPIIHRDLSSANVLLQPSPDGGWLAKVSDYGTANFQSQLQTENPGSPVYTAPESRDPALQTPKMDIYSFGVLLVEMCTCDFPAPERRAELMESIDYPRLLNLIRQCLNVDKDRRPTAAQLVELLQAMPLVTRTHT